MNELIVELYFKGVEERQIQALDVVFLYDNFRKGFRKLAREASLETLERLEKANEFSWLQLTYLLLYHKHPTFP